MIVVVIIGVMAALAIHAYLIYVKRGRTAEALDKLAMLYNESVRYAHDSNEQVDRSTVGAAVAAQFPQTTALTPVGSCCLEADGQCSPNADIWDNNPTWRALDFAVTDPHRFRYAYESTGAGPDAVFTARASGDLDCDTTLSTFERSGYITPNIEVQGSRGVFLFYPLE
jgi:type IV pilus assembly protein PilA